MEQCTFIPHADSTRMRRVFITVCLLVFPHDISQTDVARITKLDVEMFHDESWKIGYFTV